MPTPQQQHANATTKAHQCYINSLPTLQQQHAGATVTACWHHSTLVLQGQHANATATAHRHLSNAMLKPQQRQANATAQRYSSDSLPTLQRQQYDATGTACRCFRDCTPTTRRQLSNSMLMLQWQNITLKPQQQQADVTARRKPQQQHADFSATAHRCYMPKLHWQHAKTTATVLQRDRMPRRRPTLQWQHARHYSESTSTLQQQHANQGTSRFLLQCYSTPMLQLQHATATACWCYSDSMLIIFKSSLTHDLFSCEHSFV